MDEAKTAEAAPVGQAQPFKAPALDNPVSTGIGGASDVRPNIEVILDVPVTLSLEVGRAQMSVGKLHGEIVIVNDKFGIRLIDVLPPAKRAGTAA